jgi:hypothetical protein
MLYQGIIKKSWLKKHARACGMGYMCDAQQLRDPKSAGKYVSKYISKSLVDIGFPKRFKRVRYSLKFPQFEFNERESEYVWVAYQKDDFTRKMLEIWAFKTGVVLNQYVKKDAYT